MDGQTYAIIEKAKIEVRRHNETLALAATSDSLTKVFFLGPKNSFNYYANVLTYGLGFLWDKSDKRYTYQQNVYIDFHSASKKPERFRPAYEGQTDLVLSLPWMNSFHLRPYNESPKTNTGFWGISLGVDKHYASRKFITMRLSSVMDLFVPVPAAIDISGEYELMSSVWVSLTDNVRLNNTSIGYGLTYSRNTWDFQYHDRFSPPPATRDPVKKSSKSMGLEVNGYHGLTEHFNIGLIYRPSLLTVYPTMGLKYEHLISLDLAWKLRLTQ